MSLPATIIGRPRGLTSALLPGSQRRPSSLSICSNCLRSIYGRELPQQQARGKKTLLPKATAIKVRLLKDIPQYGPKGSIMMVAPGRMRSIWYQRGEAEYLTRDLEKSIGKYTVVDRDPAYKPAIASKTKKVDGHYNFLGEFIPTHVKEKLLTRAESLSILSKILPPTLRFYRATKTPTSIDLHGSVTTNDIAQAIKMIAGASGHADGGRIVVKPENISFANDASLLKVKQLGTFEIGIGYKGDPGWVSRVVRIEREEAGAGAAVAEDTPAAIPSDDAPPVKLFSTPPPTTGSASGSDQFIL